MHLRNRSLVQDPICSSRLNGWLVKSWRWVHDLSRNMMKCKQTHKTYLKTFSGSKGSSKLRNIDVPDPRNKKITTSNLSFLNWNLSFLNWIMNYHEGAHRISRRPMPQKVASKTSHSASDHVIKRNSIGSQAKVTVLTTHASLKKEPVWLSYPCSTSEMSCMG